CFFFQAEDGIRDKLVTGVQTRALPILVNTVVGVEAVEPVIPRYEEQPFLVVETSGDPTGLARAFDNRYFMASTELNLLNTLLFRSEERRVGKKDTSQRMLIDL